MRKQTLINSRHPFRLPSMRTFPSSTDDSHQADNSLTPTDLVPTEIK